MKALTLVPGTKNVSIKEFQEPKLESSTQVKVRVLEVGICGTDREEVSGGRADAPQGEKELVIGHEMVGSVVEVGAKVSRVKKGDLVVIMVRRPCKICDPCKKGCSDMCESGEYTERGIKGRHGFDTEFVVDEEEYMILVPPALKRVAVLTEPTTVVEKAIDHASRLQVARLPVDKDPQKWLFGKKALVAGLGPIGLLAATLLSLRGAKVFGMDIVDPQSVRPKILKELGGTYLLGKEEKMQEILKKEGAMDLIVEAAGIAKLDFELIDFLGINGVYVLTGVASEKHFLNVDAGKVMKGLVLKNQILLGSVNAGKMHFEMAVKDLESAQKKWPNLLEQLITSRTSFKEFEKVLLTRNPDEIKAVIEWSA